MNTWNIRTLSNDEILSILSNKHTCNVGTTDGKYVILIPMLYFIENSTAYLINKKENNISTIKDTKVASIHIDNRVSSFYENTYGNISAKGSAEIIEDKIEKQRIFEVFINKNNNNFNKLNIDEFDLIKLTISDLSGREYIY